MNRFTIEVNKRDNGVFNGQFNSGLKFEGNDAYGNTVEECLKDLVFRMEQQSINTEEDRYKNYLKAKRSMAFHLTKQFLQIIGNNWFDIKMLTDKTEETKEDLLLKMEFLEQFGFIEVDRPNGAGKRYRIIMSEEERNILIDEQIKSLQQTIQGLEYMRGDILSKSVVKKKTKLQSIKHGIIKGFSKVKGAFKTPR